MLTQDYRRATGVPRAGSGAGGTEHHCDLTNHVIAELVRHLVAEEEHLSPTIGMVHPNGDQIADHEIAEHTKAGLR